MYPQGVACWFCSRLDARVGGRQKGVDDMKRTNSNPRLYLVAGGVSLIALAVCICIYAILAPAGLRYIAGARVRTASEIAQMIEKAGAGADSALGEYAAILRRQAFVARRNRIIVLMPVAFSLTGLGAYLIRKKTGDRPPK